MQVQKQANKISKEITRFTGHTLIKHVSLDQNISSGVHELKEVGKVWQGKYKNQSILITKTVYKTIFYVPLSNCFFIINISRTLSDQHCCSPACLLFNTNARKNFGGHAEFLWMLTSLECLIVNQTMMAFLSFTPSLLLVFQQCFAKKRNFIS